MWTSLSAPCASLCEAAQCSHWVVRSKAQLRWHGEAVTEGENFSPVISPPVSTPC